MNSGLYIRSFCFWCNASQIWSFVCSRDQIRNGSVLYNSGSASLIIYTIRIGAPFLNSKIVFIILQTFFRFIEDAYLAMNNTTTANCQFFCCCVHFPNRFPVEGRKWKFWSCTEVNAALSMYCKIHYPKRNIYKMKNMLFTINFCLKSRKKNAKTIFFN